ncbi:CCCH finger DNA binding protein [Pseudohyphozyma bogoriensis]|nr:CCCH finger DNA binding protein [Pseudohyphozyma bogoriensis]
MSSMHPLPARPSPSFTFPPPSSRPLLPSQPAMPTSSSPKLSSFPKSTARAPVEHGLVISVDADASRGVAPIGQEPLPLTLTSSANLATGLTTRSLISACPSPGIGSPLWQESGWRDRFSLTRDREGERSTEGDDDLCGDSGSGSNSSEDGTRRRSSTTTESSEFSSSSNSTFGTDDEHPLAAAHRAGVDVVQPVEFKPLVAAIPGAGLAPTAPAFIFNSRTISPLGPSPAASPDSTVCSPPTASSPHRGGAGTIDGPGAVPPPHLFFSTSNSQSPAQKPHINVSIPRRPFPQQPPFSSSPATITPAPSPSAVANVSPNGYFTPQASHLPPQAPTAAQLSAYFAPPQTRQGTTSHALHASHSSPALSTLAQAQANTHHVSPLSFVGVRPRGGSPTSSGISTSSTELEAADKTTLYSAARTSFVLSSLSSLNLPLSTTSSHAGSLATHFDKAMASANPLAVLYGLSEDQVRELERLRSEGRGVSAHGIKECVFQLAESRKRENAVRGALAGVAVVHLPHHQHQQQYQPQPPIGGPMGPSVNNRKLGLYKTELCRSWEEKGSCRYGSKCQFAHGAQEIREVARHPKFKSEVCRTFWLHGSCPYGRRCCFIHTTVTTEAPTGITPATSQAPTDLRSLASSLSSVALSTPNLPLSYPPSGYSAYASAPLSDNPTPPASRLAQRMSSSSRTGLGLDATSSPYKSVPTTSSGTFTTTGSSSGSPVETRSDYFGSGNGLFGVPLNGVNLAVNPMESSSGLGLGISLHGNTKPGSTSNPQEVPPTFQDPPMSRLSRLGVGSGSASLSGASGFKRVDSNGSVSSLGAGNGASTSRSSTPPKAVQQKLGHPQPVVTFVDNPATSTYSSSLGELQPVANGWLGGQSGDLGSLEWDE